MLSELLHSMLAGGGVREGEATRSPRLSKILDLLHRDTSISWKYAIAYLKCDMAYLPQSPERTPQKKEMITSGYFDDL
jgi:hypothetical protein